MRRTDKIWWLYQAHNNEINLLFKRFQDDKDFPDNYQVKFLPIITQKNIIEIISKWLPINYELEFLSETHQKIVTLKLSKFSTRKQKWFSAIFNIIKYENTPFNIIFTYERGYIIDSVIKTLFKRFYTEAANLHISSKQIKELLFELEKEMKLDEIITEKVISYNMKKDKRETNQKWTNESYETTFEKAMNDNHLVDKIDFKAYDKNKELFIASLSREGLFKCSRDHISRFYEIVINYLFNIGKFNASIYSKKSISENDGNIKPISIRFDSPIFTDKIQNERLLKTLSTFRKSTYSVYHLNPFFYASLVDYSDGSSYDIWVLSGNKITIIPRIRATFNSLSRLCEHIFQNFRDGTLEEVALV